MKKYSQYDEQAHILNAFDGRTKPGRFLDIGCWDAVTFSNTRILFELGWAGVMIDPSPGPFVEMMRTCTRCAVDVDERGHETYGRRKQQECEECGARRYGFEERVDLVLAAVGLVPGLLKLSATDDALTSAPGSESHKTWESRAHFYGDYLIPVLSMEHIGARWGAFDFISIDTEGTAVDLFYHAVQLLKWRPKCWCVEIDGRAAELAAIAEGSGYRSVNDVGFGKLGNGTNVVLVRP